MRVDKSENGYLWFVIDSSDNIIKVFIHKHNAMKYIKDKK